MLKHIKYMFQTYIFKSNILATPGFLLTSVDSVLFSYVHCSVVRRLSFLLVLACDAIEHVERVPQASRSHKKKGAHKRNKNTLNQPAVHLRYVHANLINISSQ